MFFEWKYSQIKTLHITLLRVQYKFSINRTSRKEKFFLFLLFLVEIEFLLASHQQKLFSVIYKILLFLFLIEIQF